MRRASLVTSAGNFFACVACLSTACASPDAGTAAPEGAAGVTASAGGGSSNVEVGGAQAGGMPSSGGTSAGMTSAGTAGDTSELGGANGGGFAGGGGAGGAAGQAPVDPGPEGDGDFEVGPNYPLDPDLTDRGAPRGRSFQFTMSSADSKFYTGNDATLNDANRHGFNRRINVYVPAAYEDGSEAPLLVIHDGPGPLDRVSYALDNLTTSQGQSQRLPAFVVIAVANGGGDGKGSERGLEYDTMSDRFVRFIDEEILPAVSSHAALRQA